MLTTPLVLNTTSSVSINCSTLSTPPACVLDGLNQTNLLYISNEVRDGLPRALYVASVASLSTSLLFRSPALNSRAAASMCSRSTAVLQSTRLRVTCVSSRAVLDILRVVVLVSFVVLQFWSVLTRHEQVKVKGCLFDHDTVASGTYVAQFTGANGFVTVGSESSELGTTAW